MIPIENLHVGSAYWGSTKTWGPVRVIEVHSDDPDLIKVVEVSPERPAPQWATVVEFTEWATHEDETWRDKRLKREKETKPR